MQACASAVDPGQSALLEAGCEAVQRWRFRPATYRGDPIDVYYTVTVNFPAAVRPIFHVASAEPGTGIPLPHWQ